MASAPLQEFVDAHHDVPLRAHGVRQRRALRPGGGHLDPAARRRLAYETWYGLHLYAYLAVVLGFLHQLFVGADFMHDQVAATYWVILYVVAALTILVFRIGQPDPDVAPALGLRVANVVDEAPGVVSVYLTGRNLERLDVRAGQYFLWRWLTPDGWWRSHPYSISAAPNGEWLRITVKDLGDGSRDLQSIPIGTRVIVEGPYGILTDVRANEAGRRPHRWRDRHHAAARADRGAARRAR